MGSLRWTSPPSPRAPSRRLLEPYPSSTFTHHHLGQTTLVSGLNHSIATLTTGGIEILSYSDASARRGSYTMLSGAAINTSGVEYVLTENIALVRSTIVLSGVEPAQFTSEIAGHFTVCCH